MTNYNYNTCLYLSLVIDQDDFNPYLIYIYIFISNVLGASEFSLYKIVFLPNCRN